MRLLSSKGWNLTYSPERGSPVLWCCKWERGYAICQSFLLLPTSKLGLSGADSQVGGFGYVLGPVLHQTLLRDWECLPLLQPHRFFQSEVLRLYFPVWNPGLHSSQFICTQMWDHPVCQPLLCCLFSLPQVPISVPPTRLDECFFFNSLVVRLPCSSIFWQFWLSFVFKFVVVLLLVVQGGKV